MKGLNTKQTDEAKKENIGKYIRFEIPKGNLISVSLNTFQSGRLNKMLEEGNSEKLNFIFFFRNAVGCE